MPKLREFLNQQSSAQLADVRKAEAVLKDWIDAVEKLVDRLRGWLESSDPNHALKIEKTTHEIRERLIGRYTVSGLRVIFFAEELSVEPVARFSIGSATGDAFGKSLRNGRVDLTDGSKKYMLYRRPDSGPDDWWIVDDQSYQPRPLDQETFEEAVVSLLQ